MQEIGYHQYGSNHQPSPQPAEEKNLSHDCVDTNDGAGASTSPNDRPRLRSKTSLSSGTIYDSMNTKEATTQENCESKAAEELLALRNPTFPEKSEDWQLWSE